MTKKLYTHLHHPSLMCLGPWRAASSHQGAERATWTLSFPIGNLTVRCFAGRSWATRFDGSNQIYVFSGVEAISFTPTRGLVHPVTMESFSDQDVALYTNETPPHDWTVEMPRERVKEACGAGVPERPFGTDLHGALRVAIAWLASELPTWKWTGGGEQQSLRRLTPEQIVRIIGTPQVAARWPLDVDAIPPWIKWRRNGCAKTEKKLLLDVGAMGELQIPDVPQATFDPGVMSYPPSDASMASVWELEITELCRVTLCRVITRRGAGFVGAFASRMSRRGCLVSVCDTEVWTYDLGALGYVQQWEAPGKDTFIAWNHVKIAAFQDSDRGPRYERIANEVARSMQNHSNELQTWLYACLPGAQRRDPKETA